MTKGRSLIPRGLAGKMIRFFVIFALVMGIAYLITFVVQLVSLSNVIRSDEESQQEFVAGASQETLNAAIEANLIARIRWAADRTDDEFWIAGHNLKMLQNQVEDIYRNPENYGRMPLYPPAKENAGKPVLQLIYPGNRANITQRSMEDAERLANLEPVLKEFLLQSDFNVDIGIATMDGLVLDMDKLSQYKVMDDGSIVTLDLTEQDWYKGALERGEIFFYPIHSLLYDFDEIAYAAPVYVDGRPVAVLQGSIHIDLFKEFLEGRDLGQSGFTVLISDRGQLACSPRQTGELAILEDYSLDIRDRVNPRLKEAIDRALSGETGVTRLTVDGEDYYAAFGYSKSYKWAQIIFVSVDEAMNPANELLMQMKDISDSNRAEQNARFGRVALLALIALAVIIAASIILVGEAAKKRVRPIANMADQVSKISGDNMEFHMDGSYKTGDEIQLLAENFEVLSGNIRKYLNELVDIMSEKERTRTELSLASKIQASMLPRDFPAFPERKEFGIYADMTPAKEVGGDFYDFFLVGEDKLAMVIADVSGKGIPAAMFMMMAKTLIHGRLTAGKEPYRVFEDVNASICSGNRESMFVSVWAGILDLNTGVVLACNAGHEYPLHKEPDGEFEIFRDSHGLVIGASADMEYSGYEIRMKPGSKLFIYTDGGPEAIDKEGKQFGMDGMLRAVNGAARASAKAIIENVKHEVRRFAGEAGQFDDLTMLCIEYFGKTTQ